MSIYGKKQSMDCDFCNKDYAAAVGAALREQDKKYQSLVQLCQELDNLADGLKIPRALWPIMNGIRASLEMIRSWKAEEGGEDGDLD